MFYCNAMLLKDFYKAVHSEMLHKEMTKSVSYFTPRMSRVERWNGGVVNFGLQAFIKTWLIDAFNETFFNRPKRKVVKEYMRIIENTMGKGIADPEKIEKLHDLGYLPIEIVALPEGTVVPVHCPAFGITNTDPNFAWLGQALESLISAEMWYPMVCATVAHSYREVVNKWYDKTCDDNIPRRRALGNFDFRGDQGVEAALKAAGGWLLSFVNTATVPSIPYMEKMYNCDCEKEEVGFGAVSTEHFVMCSNSAKDIADNPDETYEYKDIDPMREIVFLKRLLTELYKDTSFSCVCDSYDYWRLVTEFLPILKNEILAHNGCFLVRGDSGDCVEVVTETVYVLWDIFGGTVNSKGYKVLDPHVKALYGDSITIQRAEEIYRRLEAHGFAACNVSLGVGSFSMHCIEEGTSYVFGKKELTKWELIKAILKGNYKKEQRLLPLTRDTFGMAIKAVYAEFTDAVGNIRKMPVFKDPITDRQKGGGNFKKSQKGCCVVYKDVDGTIRYEDNKNWDEAFTATEQLLVPIFRNGELLVDDNLQTVRARLNNNKF